MEESRYNFNLCLVKLCLRPLPGDVINASASTFRPSSRSQTPLKLADWKQCGAERSTSLSKSNLFNTWRSATSCSSRLWCCCPPRLPQGATPTAEASQVVSELWCHHPMQRGSVNHSHNLQCLWLILVAIQDSVILKKIKFEKSRDCPKV